MFANWCKQRDWLKNELEQLLQIWSCETTFVKSTKFTKRCWSERRQILGHVTSLKFHEEVLIAIFYRPKGREPLCPCFANSVVKKNLLSNSFPISQPTHRSQRAIIFSKIKRHVGEESENWQKSVTYYLNSTNKNLNISISKILKTYRKERQHLSGVL